MSTAIRNSHAILAVIVSAYICLMLLSLTCNGLCQQCGSESGVYCYNETHFQTCHSGVVPADDLAMNSLRSCPPDMVCFDNAAICGSPSNSSIAADCPSSSTSATTATVTSNRCNKCSQDGRYACVNMTAFGLCFGKTTVAMDYVFRCPTGEWCDVEAAADGAAGAFCTADETRISCALDGIPTSSSTSTTILTSTDVAATSTLATTTVSPTINTTGSTNVTEICINYRTTARLALPSDTTCRRYFYCYPYGGQYRGQQFQCVGLSYFDERQQRCVSSYTHRCINGTLVDLSYS